MSYKLEKYGNFFIVKRTCKLISTLHNFEVNLWGSSWFLTKTQKRKNAIVQKCKKTKTQDYAIVQNRKK